jgi:hypothetical protein
VRAEDPQHGREPEPATGELRGEERLEDPSLRGGVHADAGVRDLQAHVVAGDELVVEEGLGEVAAIGVDEARGERHDAAPLPDRVGRVGDEVHHHLSQLRGVALHRRYRMRELVPEHHALGDHGLQEVTHLLDQGAEIDARDEEAPLAGVGEELPRELGRAQRGGLDALDGHERRRARRQLELREAGVAEHADEEVVEVVRDAAGEHAEALELLRRDELVLEPAGLGHVLHGADDPTRRAVRVALQAAARAHPERAAWGLVAELDLHGPIRIPRGRARRRTPHRLEIGGVHLREEALPLHHRPLDAEQLAAARVEVERVVGEVDLEDARRGGLEGSAEALLGRLDHLLRAAPLVGERLAGERADERVGDVGEETHLVVAEVPGLPCRDADGADRRGPRPDLGEREAADAHRGQQIGA